MTDAEVNFLSMARVAYRELTDQRPQWEKLAPGLTSDFEQLRQQLELARTLAENQGGASSKGYTNAKDRAEQEAEEAAGRLVRGLRAVLLDYPNPALERAAAYVPSTLNRLRGEALLGALDAISAAADSAAPLLEKQGVGEAQRQRLTQAIAAFSPLVGSPRTQIVAGAVVTSTLRKLVKETRETLRRLDTRVDNLREDLPALAERYERARAIVDAGRGPGAAPMGTGSAQ